MKAPKKFYKECQEIEARKLINNPSSNITVRNLVHLDPSGTKCAYILRNSMNMLNKKDLRLILTWIFGKYNKKSQVCLKCNNGTIATMRHMISCCLINDIIRTMTKSKRIRNIMDLLNRKNNNIKMKNYVVAAKLIKKMLRTCYGIKFEEEELTRSRQLMNSTEASTLTSTNCTSSTGVEKKNTYLPPATTHLPSITSTITNMVRTKQTARNYDKPIFMPRTGLVVSKPGSSSKTSRTATSETISTMQNSTISVSSTPENDGINSSDVSLLNALVKNNECAAKVITNVDTTQSTAPSTIVPVPSTESTDYSCGDDSDSSDATPAQTKTKNQTQEQSEQDDMMRLQRFSASMLKEKQKGSRSMICKALSSVENIVEYLSTIPTFVIDDYVKKFVLSIPCNSCWNYSLKMYNKEPPVGTRVRCNSCKCSVFAAFLFPICYHAAQLLSDIDFNTPEEIIIPALPTDIGKLKYVQSIFQPQLERTDSTIVPKENKNDPDTLVSIEETVTRFLPNILDEVKASRTASETVLSELRMLKVPVLVPSEPKSTAPSTQIWSLMKESTTVSTESDHNDCSARKKWNFNSKRKSDHAGSSTKGTTKLLRKSCEPAKEIE